MLVRTCNPVAGVTICEYLCIFSYITQTSITPDLPFCTPTEYSSPTESLSQSLHFRPSGLASLLTLPHPCASSDRPQRRKRGSSKPDCCERVGLCVTEAELACGFSQELTPGRIKCLNNHYITVVEKSNSSRLGWQTGTDSFQCRDQHKGLQCYKSTLRGD